MRQFLVAYQKIHICGSCLVLMLYLFAVSIIQAQDATPQPGADCPAIVATALTITKESCSETSRNQVCYGHFVLDAAPYVGVEEDFKFNEPGDIERISAMRSLRLSAMDEAAGTWGVALMQVEAALVDSPPEDVTFVMFGDVSLNSPVELVPIHASQGTNIRRQPSSTSPIIASLAAGQTVTANGRLADSSWIRVRISEAEGSIGWVAGDLVTTDGDLESLAVVDPAGDVQTNLAYGPMQVFYLQTGEQDSPCDEAPNSGLMIQTPEGIAEVTLLVNEVDITLRATAFVQAQPEGDLSLYVLEGSATVQSNGVSHTLVPGTMLHVPLDENGTAAGPPSEPEPYSLSPLQSLPLDLLDRPVEVPPPVDTHAGVPLSGTWNFAWGVREAVCPNGQIVEFETTVGATSIRVAEDASRLDVLLTSYVQVETGVYEAIFLDISGNTHRYRLHVDSLDHISGEANIQYLDLDCNLTVPFSLSLVSADG